MSKDDFGHAAARERRRKAGEYVPEPEESTGERIKNFDQLPSYVKDELKQKGYVPNADGSCQRLLRMA